MEIKLSPVLCWLALIGHVLANGNESIKNKDASSKTRDGGEFYGREMTETGEETRLNENMEKRAPKYDPGLKYLGLGKRQPLDGNELYTEEDMATRVGVKKSGGGRSRLDPAYKFMGLGKRKKPSKFDPAMRFMGLGKRQEPGSDSVDDEEIEMAQYDNYQKRKKPSKYDPAMKFMGLGKRQQFGGSDDATVDEEMSKRGFYKFDGHKRKKPSKYDPAMKFMGLGKREIPAGSDASNEERNSGHLHTRQSFVVKRAARPRFDPGWKFIGLGKRLLPDDNTEEMEKTEQELALRNTNPYLGALALQNLTHFFEEVRHSLSDEPRRYPDASASLSSEEWSPLYLPESQNNHEYSGYVRARKPSTSGGFNLGLNNRNKPLYDPSWSLTGLGRK